MSLAMKRTMIACLVCFCFATNAHAEPTKKETYNFLEQKLSFSNGDGSETYKLKSSNNFCTLTWTHIYNRAGATNNYNQTADLVDMDPKEVEAYRPIYYKIDGQGGVRMATREKKKLIRNGAGDHSIYINFSTRDLDDAERVKDALKHLIVTCGGKSELF
jgi:hypothetical protein